MLASKKLLNVCYMETYIVNEYNKKVNEKKLKNKSMLLPQHYTSLPHYTIVT